MTELTVWILLNFAVFLDLLYNLFYASLFRQMPSNEVMKLEIKS